MSCSKEFVITTGKEVCPGREVGALTSPGTFSSYRSEIGQ